MVGAEGWFRAADRRGRFPSYRVHSSEFEMFLMGQVHSSVEECRHPKETDNPGNGGPPSDSAIGQTGCKEELSQELSDSIPSELMS